LTEQQLDSPGDAPALIPLLLASVERTREYLPLATELLLDPDKHALAAVDAQQ
jgi:hypothetical protein